MAIPAFCACAFSIIFNKTLPNPVPQRFSPVFYCRSCIISHSMLVLIYFDLTFVFSIRENSNFFFACGYSIFPALFVEEIFFPLYPWHSLQRSNDHIHGSLFLSFLLYSIGVYISVFIWIYTILITEAIFWIRKYETVNFVFLFQENLGYFMSMWILGWVFLFLQKIFLGFW